MKTHEQFADDLALYALDEVAGSDRQEFEEHLHTCASCRRELQALRGDLGLLGLSSSGPQPPARSKERLMQAIAAEPPRAPASVPIELPRRSLWWAWVPTFAAVALFFVAIGTWNSNGTLKQNNQRLHDAVAELANQNQDLSLKYKQAEESLGLLHDPNAVHVSLNPQKGPRQPSGTAIFSPSQKRMIFLASNLPPVPEGKAYELWIIPATGAPTPAGVFKPDEHGNVVMMDHEMPPGAVAKAFAITVEDEAGSDKPTSPIMLMGATG